MDISIDIGVFSLVSDVPLSIFDKIIAHNIRHDHFYKVQNANWTHTVKCEAGNVTKDGKKLNVQHFGKQNN